MDGSRLAHTDEGFDTPSQVGAGFLSFVFFVFDFWSFSLGSRPALLPPRPYFRFCVMVAVLLSSLPTETSL